MHGVVVQIPQPESRSKDEIRALVEKAVPRFQGLDGLSIKYFLLTEDNKVGGVYIFESRAKADAFFTEAWRARATETWGAAPQVQHFEIPAIVDNAAAAAAKTAAE
jgi:hypothetical protein